MLQIIFTGYLIILAALMIAINFSSYGLQFSNTNHVMLGIKISDATVHWGTGASAASLLVSKYDLLLLLLVTVQNL